MGVIRQLPENVANQISAGEVIERPASIVKELIENSIDAGSTDILIEIKNGGRDRIRIKDNGRGIAVNDMELAFSRFATSKIENVNDLYSIKTLGFRGEALASIASISKIEINSRSVDSLKGSKMLLSGGEIVKKVPAGLAVGTDIIVTDIFYNTPARYKYLKTINTEFGHISNIVSREAMAFPEIKFTLVHNNREVLKTPGTGKFLDTIYTIYGEEIVNNLIETDYEESYVKISGFIALPSYTRSSRIHQLFFVNKRTVYNPSLNRGVEKAYQGLLAPGRYPLVFLNMKLNQILVDVNVHPSKREIKFSREEIIEKIITKGVKKTLSLVNPAPQLKVNNKTKKDGQKIKQYSFNDTLRNNKTNSDNYIYSEKFHLNIDNKIAEDEKNNEDKNSDSRYKDIPSTSKYKDIQHEETVDNEPIDRTGKEKVYLDREEFHNNSVKIKKVFGQIANTYILVEGEDGLYIIDQHNAHERVLYERNYERYKRQEVIAQRLIVPVNIEVTLEENELINKYAEELNKLGINIEPFGSTSFIITEVPVSIKNIPGKRVIREIIDNLLENGKSLNHADIINNIITYMSCRGAIKAGKYMDMKEMKELVIDLFNTKNPNRCPHGRPIIVHLSNEDIARSMGR